MRVFVSYGFALSVDGSGGCSLGCTVLPAGLPVVHEDVPGA
ncbi:hypothetical protein STRIP9103_07352 [Streptomyces ipomoeae 91-03]|uniref:Uncharacterized protein n=1 Tax=Streptomyces ipomoeae 91-03 TaxID=698759 RepID=L1KQ75_9ACTN|nr:hypothetical protein STRIP9103_07352 [Streptomyces ipomoeae 91-03]